MAHQPTTFVSYHEFTRSQDKEITVARRDDTNQTATFRYKDDCWFPINLLEPHERNCEASVYFSSLPSWLREDTKRYIAHLWLDRHPKKAELQQALVAVRHLGKALPDFKGRPIDLRMRHARQFARELKKHESSHSTNKQIVARLNAFMRFVRQQHPEESGNDFKVVLPKPVVTVRPYEPLEKSLDSVIPTETLVAIIEACNADLQSYYDAKETYMRIKSRKEQISREL